jgi:hypothetical protein
MACTARVTTALAAMGIAAMIAGFGGAAIYAATDGASDGVGGWGGPVHNAGDAQGFARPLSR